MERNEFKKVNMVTAVFQTLQAGEEKVLVFDTSDAMVARINRALESGASCQMTFEEKLYDVIGVQIADNNLTPNNNKVQ